MNKTKITIAIITILLLIAIGYIVFGESSKYLQGERLLAYQQGQQDGVLGWNQQVIQTANSEGKIPFIVNGTIQTISIEQLCKER